MHQLKNKTAQSHDALVRPVLEYSSSVWDPHTQTLINQLEAVQNRAARFVTGNYSRKSSVTKMKKDLNWPDLATRRKVARLNIFNQAIGGHLAIPTRNILRPVKRSTRLTSPNSRNFTPLSANKNCYKQSFLPRTLVDWNNLPKPITIIEEKEKFKSAVNKHFNIKEGED